VHFQTILNSMRRETPRPHKPRFSVKRYRDGWHVLDAGKAIAFVNASFLDIWSFSPFEPDEIANTDVPGKVVDLHTVHNTFLNFGAQTWPRHWAGCVLDWRWQLDEGPELAALIALAGPGGETCAWRFTIAYDPAWARYRFRFHIHARKREPDGFECFNLMTAGALEDRPEKRRWTHSLWENADGQLKRIVHSNALFHDTDFSDSRWRNRHMPYPQSWMAYATHATFNPAFLIHKTTVPVQIPTCSQLFDEHIIWGNAGQDNLGEDGYFHFQMELEFVNMPARLSSDLLSHAADPVKPAKWWHDRSAIAFRMGEVNRFDALVDPWQPEDAPILDVPQKGVEWANVGHEGTHSIKLSADDSDEPVRLFPMGAVCKVRPHSRVRLSGWIKCNTSSNGSARLVLFSYCYTYNNVDATAASEKVSGKSGWTRVEVELDSGDMVYVMPQMELTGPGEAWFTEVCLEEAAVEAAATSASRTATDTRS
jgi:hypothetical protein